MGGRSKNKSSSGSYNPVKKVTQGDAMKSLNGVMDKQLGFVGTIMDALIPRGEAMMADNPGLANFMRKAGQTKDKFDDYFDAGPLGLLDKIGENLNIQTGGSNAPSQQNPMGLTPEQLAQYQQYNVNKPNYDYNSTFNINDYMRNQFNK